MAAPRTLLVPWRRQPQGAGLQINKRHWLAKHIIFAHDGQTAYVEGEPAAPLVRWQTGVLGGDANFGLSGNVGWIPDASSYAEYAISSTHYPVSISCWHYGSGGATLDVLLSLEASDTSSMSLRRSNGEFITAVSRTSGGNPGTATCSASGYVFNKWRHGVAVITGDAARAAYEDGGSKGTGTLNRAVSPCTSLKVGAATGLTTATTVIGGICVPLVINRELTDAEVLRLYEEQRDNPWSIFAPRRIFVPVASAAPSTPTVTALSAIGITASSAQPRISYS